MSDIVSVLLKSSCKDNEPDRRKSVGFVHIRLTGLRLKEGIQQGKWRIPMQRSQKRATA
jgi:hypothetical protein